MYIGALAGLAGLGPQARQLQPLFAVGAGRPADGQHAAVACAEALKTAKYDKLTHLRPDRRKTNALLPF